jgi:hypothetical protein
MGNGTKMMICFDPDLQRLVNDNDHGYDKNDISKLHLHCYLIHKYNPKGQRRRIKEVIKVKKVGETKFDQHDSFD